MHRTTSFRWRHRFLHLSKHDRPSSLSGIAEAAELFLLESQKGSRRLTRPACKSGGVATKRGISKEHDCVLVARDRDGRTFDFMPGRGAVTKAQLHAHLLPVLEADILLVTDAHTAYRAFARAAGISHEAVCLRQGERARGAVHVQNVNGYHRRFRQWLARFNGDSALISTAVKQGSHRGAAETPCNNTARRLCVAEQIKLATDSSLEPSHRENDIPE